MLAPDRSPVRRAVLAGAGCAAVLLLGGCGEQSALEPRSDASRSIATLWWWMLAAASVVFLGAVALLVIAWVRRRRAGFPFIGEREGAATSVVVLFGMVIPAVGLIALFAVGNFAVAEQTDAPAPSTTPLTIEVTGRQFFWSVRYPGTPAVTANEIHIPVDTRVNLVGKTGDVIHSFWVPQLNRKIDLVPGRTNRILLYADRPGRYRGQCAELCGEQHGHMGMYVYADPPERFRAWLAGMSADSAAPDTEAARRGREVFLSNACASCHTIRGTAANGTVGPDLTHVAGRTTLAALTIPNTRSSLTRWIDEPQHIKPGNRMPELDLTAPELHDVVTYLEQLR